MSSFTSDGSNAYVIELVRVPLSGSFIAVGHEGESAVILRWDPAKDVPATLVARVPRSAPSGFLDSFAFDGTRHFVVRRGQPSKITTQAGAMVAEVASQRLRSNFRGWLVKARAPRRHSAPAGGVVPDTADGVFDLTVTARGELGGSDGATLKEVRLSNPEQCP